MRKTYEEFQLVQNVNGHPHIADYLYFMRENDQAHLIMEYVPGGSLHKDIKKHPGTFTYDKTILIARQLLSVLTIMYRQKINHQDLKPQNIMLMDDRKTIKVIDFGLARSLNSTLPRCARAEGGTD